MKLSEDHFGHLLKALTDIGIALSAEKDHTRLLEMILEKALEITHADGGTIYTCTDENTLKFEIMINRSMGMHLGGTSDNKVHYEDLPLYNQKGEPNVHMLAPWAALNKQSIQINNAYKNKKFDLSGTKHFDQISGYHSQSFLTVPMTNHLNEVIGVLQLINALDKNQKIIPFSKLDALIVESLAAQAAVTITNRQLIEAQKKLFDALIQLIAKAIDEKSPHTGGHCRRVPVIAKMLANSTCRINKGPLQNFRLTEEELYELEVAAWLHDCGKITTPEAVVDKATKLEQIIDGIQLIDIRFEVLKRDEMIATLQEKLHELTGQSFDFAEDRALQYQLAALNNERELVRQCNIGSEQTDAKALAAIGELAKRKWLTAEGNEAPFLSESEVQMLGISRGTLSKKERGIINNHVSMSIKMLESLPYPKQLKNVPELAGSHHEKIDGSGYPKGLTKDQMSLQARMIAIADVFEALTAHDRPYRKAMPLSQALCVLGQMKVDGHIDPDLFDVFMHEKVYLHYAQAYLDIKNIEQIDLSTIPGYTPLD